MTTTRPKLDAFTRAYLECALWSSINPDHDNDPDVPEMLDALYDIEDIAPEALEKCIEDCRDFQEANADLLTAENYVGFSQWSVDERAGHDFWLTRNGHGAGFWDGDWSKEAGRKLTEAAKVYGSVDLYPGDDGLVYIL